MSASFVQHQQATPRCVSVLSPFLKHLNMGTLALVMFVALALLSSTRGKESPIRDSPLGKAAKSEIVIDKDHKLIDAVRPATLDYRTESAQGYLKVYSATDEFNDGGLAYYSHSSYTIYATDGRLVKSVENHISPNDESPELVALPVGSYLVMARSDRHAEVSIRVTIKARQLTVLDLDLGEETDRDLALRMSSQLADNGSAVR
jgi:hypothetical protein